MGFGNFVSRWRWYCMCQIRGDIDGSYLRMSRLTPLLMPFILPWHYIHASWRKLKQNLTLLSAPKDYPRLLTARHYLMWRPCLKSFFVGTLPDPWVCSTYAAPVSLTILDIAIRCTRTDDTYEGYFIPAGSYVFVNIWYVYNASSMVKHVKWC